MAEVWIARMRGKHGFERMVAVKTILPKYASDPQFQKMFLDEARIASGIAHTNVAQTLDLGEQHGVLFIVMELVEGDALTKLLAAVSKRESKVPHGIILRILADTCGGLHAAHELKSADGALLGVIHRDVSPQNILVTTRGVAKLIDFGIAKAKDRLSGETSSGLVKGKVKYMAPEQALGRPTDRRVDIWAIGAILYRVLAGRPPYAGANELEMLHALTSGRPPLPFSPSVPPAIGNVALRALAHDQERRFASAAEMQTAMEQAMAEIGAATSTYDVQEFIADHLLDRSAGRKQTIELALSAARERDRMAQLLKPAETESSSGIVDVGSRVLAASKKPIVPTPPVTERMMDVRPSATPPSRPGAPAFDDDDGDVTVALDPLATKPLSMPPPLFPPPPKPLVLPRDSTVDALTSLSQTRRRTTFLAVVTGAVAGLAVVMLIAVAMTRGESEGHAVATATFGSWAKTLRLPAATAAAPSPDATTAQAPTPASAFALAAVTAPQVQTTAPKAPTTTTATPTVASTPPPRPTATATTTTPPKKPRVDVDGF